MNNGFFLYHIWLIPLFPAAGALLMFLFGKRLPNAVVNVICVGSVVTSFVFAGGAVLQLIARPAEDRFVQMVLFDWVPAGWMHTAAGHLLYFDVALGLMLDPLNAVMVMVVTGVGMLIHIYSTGYMAHEGGYYRFFGYLNLFMFSMLTLILANNMLLLFVGWEGVGLCSYLLIGFYFLRKSASDAGKKAVYRQPRGRRRIYPGAVSDARNARHNQFPPDSSGHRRGSLPHGSTGDDGDRFAFCLWAPPASQRKFRSTSGCPTRWKAQRLSAR